MRLCRSSNHNVKVSPRPPQAYFRTIRLNKARAFGSYDSVANRYGRACIRATTSSRPGKT